MSLAPLQAPRVARAIRFAFAATLLFAASASAQIAQKPRVDTDADLKVTVAGQIVSIDPATGRLRTPTPQQSQSLLESLRRITDPKGEPTLVVHDNGMLSIELPEAFEEATIARLNPDGSLGFECVAAPLVERALAAPPLPHPSDVFAAPAVSAPAAPPAKKARGSKLAKTGAASTTRAAAVAKTTTPDR